MSEDNLDNWKPQIEADDTEEVRWWVENYYRRVAKLNTHRQTWGEQKYQSMLSGCKQLHRKAIATHRFVNGLGEQSIEQYARIISYAPTFIGRDYTQRRLVSQPGELIASLHTLY